eukprot:2958012-Amphidinium_carterae.3
MPLNEEQEYERDLAEAIIASKEQGRQHRDVDSWHGGHDPTAQSTRIADDAAAYKNPPPAARQPSALNPLAPPTVQTPLGRIPSTPGRGPDHQQRVRRVFAEEGAQTEGTGHIDWRYFDVDKAMRNLHSASQRTRLLTLRRLHVRWFHCTASQLSQILRHAGISEEVIQEIPLVLDSCNICRLWQRPSHRPKTAHRVVDIFNAE